MLRKLLMPACALSLSAGSAVAVLEEQGGRHLGAIVGDRDARRCQRHGDAKPDDPPAPGAKAIDDAVA